MKRASYAATKLGLCRKIMDWIASGVDVDNIPFDKVGEKLPLWRKPKRDKETGQLKEPTPPDQRIVSAFNSLINADKPSDGMSRERFEEFKALQRKHNVEALSLGGGGSATVVDSNSYEAAYASLDDLDALVNAD